LPIAGNFSYLTKVIVMNQIHQLYAKTAYYQQRISECTEIIKGVTDSTPAAAKQFVFSIRGLLQEVTVVSLDINEDESQFIIGVFMSWHTFFSKRLKELQAKIATLEKAGN